jgi:hypothetical protein
MSRLIFTAFDAFLRSSLLLAIAALVVCLVLRVFRPKSPRSHRLSWGCVLLCGILVFQVSLKIPWYDPLPTISRPVSTASDELPDLSGLASPTSKANDDAEVPLAVSSRTADVRGTIDWRRLLVGTWVVGMAAMILVTATSYLLLLRSIRRTTPASATWRRQWQQLLTAEGIREHPAIGSLAFRPLSVSITERLRSRYSRTDMGQFLDRGAIGDSPPRVGPLSTWRCVDVAGGSTSGNSTLVQPICMVGCTTI